MPKAFYLLLLLLIYNIAQADCAGPISKTFKREVLSCKNTKPSDDKKLVMSLENFENGEKIEILNSYRGYELNTLDGKLFIPINAGLSCSSIYIGKEADITVDYACCDGDPNPPCYLGYSEIVTEIEYR